MKRENIIRSISKICLIISLISIALYFEAPILVNSQTVTTGKAENTSEIIQRKNTYNGKTLKCKIRVLQTLKSKGEGIK